MSIVFAQTDPAMPQTSIKRLLIILFLVPYCSFAQNPQLDSLDAFIAKQVADYHIPGVAVGVISNNQVVCTKAFTSAAMGILVDKGRVRWDDKVIKYLPDFKLSDPWITKELTIADVLSHRSGLESYEGDLLWYGSSYSRQEIARRIRYSRIRNHFRSDYGYQNVMYLVAGLIIEKITGESWDDFIKENIFAPLSMHNSSTSITALEGKDYSRPHLTNKPIPLLSLDNIAPAGAINSTIDDMLRWMQLWINKGSFNGNQLLSEDSYKTISTIKVMLSNESDEGYGFGWNIGFENGKKVLSHGGGLPGYKSFITLIPAEKTGIIVLTNRLTYLNEELTGIIQDYFNSGKTDLKDAESELMGKNFHFPWDEVDTTNKQASVITNFALYKGLYEDQAYGTAVIKEEKGEAILSLLPSEKQFTGRLSYVSANKLRIVFNDKFVPAGYVNFSFDKAKKPTGFKLDIDSGDFLFKYLDFKRKK
jgi:CubicO group peptidase (beta-lactamase class C family)